MISKFHFYRSNFQSLLLQLVLTLRRGFAEAAVLITVLQHRSNSHGVDGLEAKQLKPHSVVSCRTLSLAISLMHHHHFPGSHLIFKIFLQNFLIAETQVLSAKKKKKIYNNCHSFIDVSNNEKLLYKKRKFVPLELIRPL